MSEEALRARKHIQRLKHKKRGRSCLNGKPSLDKFVFCREKGHWNRDCPKLQGKYKRKGKVTFDACVVRLENDESDFVLIGLPMTSHYDE